MISDINASYIGQLLAFIAIGSIIDQLVGTKSKEAAARYIFGWVGASFSEFESSFITGLVGAFCRRSDIEHLSKLRVFFLSFVISSIAFVFIFIVNVTGVIDSTGMSWIADNPFWIVVIVSFGACLILAIISFPFDLYSMYITKKVFYFQHYPPQNLPKKIGYDLFESLMPFIVVVAIVAVLLFVREISNGAELSFLQFTLSYALGVGSLWPFFAANISATLFVTLIQILGLIGGVGLRWAFSNPSLKGLKDSGRLRRNPFLYVFFALGVIVSIVDAILYLWRII